MKTTKTNYEVAGVKKNSLEVKVVALNFSLQQEKSRSMIQRALFSRCSETTFGNCYFVHP